MAWTRGESATNVEPYVSGIAVACLVVNSRPAGVHGDPNEAEEVVPPEETFVVVLRRAERSWDECPKSRSVKLLGAAPNGRSLHVRPLEEKITARSSRQPEVIESVDSNAGRYIDRVAFA